MLANYTRSIATRVYCHSRLLFPESRHLISTLPIQQNSSRKPTDEDKMTTNLSKSFHIVMRGYSKKPDIATSFNVQDDEDFNARVLHAKIPIIVDFHAEWCGPCKQLGPRLEQEVDKHDGNVMLAKVDIDDFGELAMKYKIMAVPTVMLFNKGKPVDSFQGNIDDDQLKVFVSNSLG